ncbi:polyketide synthase, partial [Janthinobacterium sp.]|uniref:type I polyketide synthase n=1 Tax=Janthinobacterium sp. TaxID=1871054 RepID=UPI002583019D
MEKGNSRHVSPDGIAVIGIAARLPGAGDYAAFWDNLKNLHCSVSEVPAQRWDAERYYSSASDDLNKSVSKWGGFIEGVDLFDSMFFGISPREARMMDPQQRIALELAWACIEDAGYAQDRLRGSRTGVYLGVMNFDYRERLTEAVGAIAGHMSTGAHTALIANRLSHFFDWRGPSMPIDTACSSSLVALHEAVHSLQRGECAQALVGGVSVLCSPTHYVSFSKTGMLSPDGLCRTFDDRANGYVRGEGAGLALLKPVRQAMRDGDRIYGVIRGTAVNHGGKARTVTYPNPLAQADVIASAHKRAGFAPDSIDYIEAHGTGTPKGDPIEISGLKTAFVRLAEDFGSPAGARSCGLGSLKANVGHLEPVAGIAGLIKVLLAMQHRTLPGLAHFQQLNHRIDLSDSPFYIVEKTQAWPARLDAHGKVQPRRAGVSSFGFGGVNAHAVIEEFITPPAAARRAAPAPAGLAMV